MEAKNLRSGNFVNFIIKNNNNDIVHLLCKINGASIHEMEIEGNEKYAYAPILLNEEWLYKLADGYIIKKHKESIFTVDRFQLIWKPEYKYWRIICDIDLTYITKVEWVHEWQNVFFALNGQELKYKEECITYAVKKLDF